LGVLRNFFGRNTPAKVWAGNAVLLYGLSGVTRTLLYFIATNTCFRLWRRFCMSIEGVRKALGCSRSSVEKALKMLRDLKLIAYDGQVASGKRRPFVVYRLSGTPECPLPQWVVEAREEEREAAMPVAGEDALTCTFTHSSKPTGPAVLVEDQGDTPDIPSISPTAGVSNYRPASPVKTGPQAKPQPSGSVRRPTHLRWLRSAAAALVTRRGGLVPGAGLQASQEGAGGVAAGFGGLGSERLCSPSTTAVTYSHPPTRGATVQPFIDPVFGNLSRDTRLLYLGLREAHTRGERTYSDLLFLKSQFFPYDADIDAPYLQDLVNTLVAAGKIHIVDGDVVLSDPPTTSKEVALLAAPPKRTRAKAPLEDPWFAAFWELYPRRTGKGAARKAYVTAVTSGVSPQAINDAAASYADRCQALQKEPQFIPHPATWLNQERWDDDEEQAPRVRSKVDDAMRSGLDLVNFYQQQEAIDFSGPKELGW
jgi:hypothetical protein